MHASFTKKIISLFWQKTDTYIIMKYFLLLYNMFLRFTLYLMIYTHGCFYQTCKCYKNGLMDKYLASYGQTKSLPWKDLFDGKYYSLCKL